MSVVMPLSFPLPVCGSFPIDPRRQRGLHPALAVKQQKTLETAALGADSPPLDVVRLEQFLDLQQSLFSGDADGLAERLVQAVAGFLRVGGGGRRGVGGGPLPPPPAPRPRHAPPPPLPRAPA